MIKKREYYKGQYFIVFYDKSDEWLLHMFSNVRELLTFQGKELTRHNILNADKLLMRALNKENHSTRMLDGTFMKVYIIDIDDEYENELKEADNGYYK